MMAMEEFNHVIIGRIIFFTQFYHFTPELREKSLFTVMYKASFRYGFSTQNEF